MATSLQAKSNPTRRKVPLTTVTAVLTEAGYRCAVPTCRNILALDMHHIHEVSEGGGNQPANLIALCPTDHALFHRGTISRESLYAWKSMLVAIARAFDVEAIDKLLFLEMCSSRVPIGNMGQPIQGGDFLIVSGDGLLHYSRLIAAGLAEVEMKANNGFELVTYAIKISDKGRQLIHAWKQGDRTALEAALIGPTSPPPDQGEV